MDSSRLWPRAMVRRLLLDHEIGLASRVLIVGLAQAPLGCRLQHLGLEVSHLDESSEQVMSGRRACAELTIDHWREGEPIPVNPQSFDLVLIREHSAFRENLYSPRTTQTLADLLSVLRPGGNLILTGQYADTGAIEGHDPACLQQMFAQLPGLVRQFTFRESLFSTESLRRIVSTRTRQRRTMLSFTLPPVSIERNQWRKLALGLEEGHNSGCCREASLGNETGRRAA